MAECYITTKEVLVKEVKKNYRCIHDLLHDYGFPDDDWCTISLNNKEYVASDYMPFYLKNGKFREGIQYSYLPFDEYMIYGISDDAKLIQTNGGKGGDGSSELEGFLVVYNALNLYLKNNPIINDALVITGSLLVAYMALNKVVRKPENILSILSFAKEKNIMLKSNDIDYYTPYYSDDKRKEIDVGLKYLQELNNSSMLEEAMNELTKEKNREYKMYSEKFDKGGRG